MSRLLRSVLDRIERNTVFLPDAPGCWVWMGATGTRQGHGKITMPNQGNDRHVAWVHRAAYEALVGPIPDGGVVRHACDFGSCWRPDHLRLGTYKDNTRDMLERGRHQPNRHLSDEVAREVAHSPERAKDLIRRLGLKKTCVTSIRAGRTYASITGLPRRPARPYRRRVQEIDPSALRRAAPKK